MAGLVIKVGVLHFIAHGFEVRAGCWDVTHFCFPFVRPMDTGSVKSLTGCAAVQTV